MKLKLTTRDTERLRTTLSLISHVRKRIVLRFTPTKLLVILVEENNVTEEPQIWCKLNMTSLFDLIEIQSVKTDSILLELSIDSLLQALKNYEKANSHDLHIRLQKRDIPEGETLKQKNSRLVSLVFVYSSSNESSNSVSNIFRIPAKVLKHCNLSDILDEPVIEAIDLIMKLPNEFAALYKRLEKFKKSSQNEMVKIKASAENGGFLGFVLEEEDKYKVTISWNRNLQVQALNYDAIKSTLEHSEMNGRPCHRQEQTGTNLATTKTCRVLVRLRDWNMASKIVANCENITLLLANHHACVLHCYLDESEEIEIMYYINALKL